MSLPRQKPWLSLSAAPDLLLVDCSVVNIEEGQVQYNRTIHLKNGKIAFVSDGTDDDHLYDGGSTVVVLGGAYVCPGLIDCHVHLTAAAGQPTMKDLFSAHPNAIAYRTVYNAKHMLLRGFTTARDTGGADAALKEAIAECLVPGPRLFIAGKALSQTGGHGDLRQAWQDDTFKCCGGHAQPSLGRVCDGVPECLAAARDELRKGADFLKIMVGGGVASPTDPLEMLQFTSGEIQAITTTANQMGKYVTAHAYTVQAIRHAINNGVMGIEHGNFIDQDTARLCAHRGIFVTPTLVTYQAMSQPPYEEFLPEDGRGKNIRVRDSGLRALRILSDAGVTMCYGSDLLAGMHSMQNEEFGIRARVLSPLQILRSATINAAKLLNMEGQLGTIRQGAIADLLILKRNPLEDVSVLNDMKNSCTGIIKDGRAVMSQVAGLDIDEAYK
jgi:imidazolonepropionase-like amidohydrolase